MNKFNFQKKIDFCIPRLKKEEGEKINCYKKKICSPYASLIGGEYINYH